jgi:DNA adenine methylase
MPKKPTFMSYFGGKARFEDFICPIIPKDIKRYCEPFAGSFAIYFLADFKNDIEIVFNDLNRDQANVFACSKEYKKYLEIIDYHLNDPNGKLYCESEDIDVRKDFYKKLYYSYKQSDFSSKTFNIPDFERAAIYIFLSTSAFNSCHFTAAGFSGFNKKRMKLLTFINKLNNEKLQEKLENIDIIETLNFVDFIKKYDSKETFFYLDPPYYEEKDKRSSWYGTKDEFGQQEHIELLKLLKTTKSRWALSYYYFPKLEEYLPKDEFVWIEKDFFRSSASFSENKSVKGTELLILNYRPDAEFESYDEPKIKEDMKELGDKLKKVVDGIEWLPDTTNLVERMTKADIEVIRKKIDEGEKSGFVEDFDKDEFLKEIKQRRDDAENLLVHIRTEDDQPYISEKSVKKNILQIDDKKEDDIDDFWFS